MAVQRKKAAPKTVEQTSSQPVINDNPLVFISHDTRDAELAEAFSNLLKSASAGGLKSFRSSDKKGTQGIEYGLDWYPAIMDKIDEASDVVCLLTTQSVERPWILYEAGVAKGKLGKKVIGIAMGIPHSIAFTGPFAQFQNNDGSVDSITKLVIDLVSNVPGLAPEREYVEPLVETFHKKATEIIAQSSEPKTDENTETKDNIIVAKLFEEVKIMFESLPSRIENRIDPERRKKRKIHPMMYEDMLHLGMKSNDSSLGFLIMLSFYKDDFPWLYEIGLETYRSLKSSKNASEKKKIISNFDKALEMLRHPMFREYSSKSEEMLSHEIRHGMHRFFERFLIEEKIE